MSRFLAACIVAGLLAFALPAAGQTATVRLHEAALKRGNAAYNAGDYPTAIQAYIEAIQAAPALGDAYRNLARALFWHSDYPAALEFYDRYLRLPPGPDFDRVKAERRLAAERAGERLYTVPEPQKLALAALERELDAGRAYTVGGGGAWGMYETLLRTGYADPHLVNLRQRLARRLLDEFDAYLVPRAGQLTPRLDLDGWQLQAERLAAAQSVADDPALAEILAKRESVVEAAIALLTSQWQEAANLARLGRTANPDLDFVLWFELSALIGAESYDAALTTLQEADAELGEPNSARRDYAAVMRAIVLQRLGRTDDAAAIYLDVLRR